MNIWVALCLEGWNFPPLLDPCRWHCYEALTSSCWQSGSLFFSFWPREFHNVLHLEHCAKFSEDRHHCSDIRIALWQLWHVNISSLPWTPLASLSRFLDLWRADTMLSLCICKLSTVHHSDPDRCVAGPGLTRANRQGLVLQVLPCAVGPYEPSNSGAAFGWSKLGSEGCRRLGVNSVSLWLYCLDSIWFGYVWILFC